MANNWNWSRPAKGTSKGGKGAPGLTQIQEDAALMETQNGANPKAAVGTPAQQAHAATPEAHDVGPTPKPPPLQQSTTPPPLQQPIPPPPKAHPGIAGRQLKKFHEALRETNIDNQPFNKSEWYCNCVGCRECKPYKHRMCHEKLDKKANESWNTTLIAMANGWPTEGPGFRPRTLCRFCRGAWEDGIDQNNHTEAMHTAEIESYETVSTSTAIVPYVNEPTHSSSSSGSTSWANASSSSGSTDQPSSPSTDITDIMRLIARIDNLEAEVARLRAELDRQRQDLS